MLLYIIEELRKFWSGFAQLCVPFLVYVCKLVVHLFQSAAADPWSVSAPSTASSADPWSPVPAAPAPKPPGWYLL